MFNSYIGTITIYIKNFKIFGKKYIDVLAVCKNSSRYMKVQFIDLNFFKYLFIYSERRILVYIITR